MVIRRSRPGLNGQLTLLGARVLAVCLVLPLLAVNAWIGYRIGLPDTVLGLVSPSEQPLSIRDPGAVWAAGVLLLWFGLVYWRGMSVAWWEALLVFVGATAAMLRAGNLWLLGLAMVIPLARQLSTVWSNPATPADTAKSAAPAPIPRWTMPVAATAAIAIAVALALLTRPVAAPPRAIAAALQAPPDATILADWRWAADLQRRLGDDRHVLAAGGLLSEPASFWIDYLRVAHGYEHTDDVLSAYDVRLVFLDSGDQAALGAQVIRDSADWHVSFDADGALVAQRG
jgi:hypothetical protein